MDFKCKRLSIGIGEFVRCLEDGASECPFAVSVGSAVFCTSHYRLDTTSIQLIPQSNKDQSITGRVRLSGL